MVAEDILIQKIYALPPPKIDEVIDFVEFLSAREAPGWRSERSSAIATYAEEFGGTEFDLDETLEASGIDSLIAADEASQ